MTTNPILLDYASALDSLLTPPPSGFRGRSDIPPAAPLEEGQLELAQSLLLQSQEVAQVFAVEWQSADSTYQQSVVEVQLLGSAAADLAIAERLAQSAFSETSTDFVIHRSASLIGREALMMRAITEPEKLLAPERLISYRVGASQELLAATYECLRFIRYETIEASKDAMGSMVALDFAVLREAAEFVGEISSKHFAKIATGLMKTALDYVLVAVEKIGMLLGPEGVQRVKMAVLGFVQDMQQDIVLSRTVDKFLNTDAIYKEGKSWVQSFEGSDEALKSTALEIGALQGSYRGRVKIADLIIKGLAIARLLPPMTALPWGPLTIASAYLLVTGYVLFSAHDHVDSDKYAFFDRVQGVRGTLISDLNISDTSV